MFVRLIAPQFQLSWLETLEPYRGSLTPSSSAEVYCSVIGSFCEINACGASVASVVDVHLR